MPDPVKYYDGSFCEPGNFGKETPIINDAWHTRVVYAEKYGLYMASSAPVNENSSSAFIRDFMELRVSNDLISWSEPISIERDGKKYGSHYNAIISRGGKGDPCVVEGDEFSAIICHNGTDVTGTDFELR